MTGAPPKPSDCQKPLPGAPVIGFSDLLGRVLPLCVGRVVYSDFHGPQFRTWGEITRLTESNIWIKWDGDPTEYRRSRRRASGHFISVAIKRPNDPSSPTANP